MKIRLSRTKICQYYERKGFIVEEGSWRDDSKEWHILLPDVNSNKKLCDKYGSLDEDEVMRFLIPTELDRAPGGGFIDPLRLAPVDWQGETDARIFGLEKLGATEAWATLGTLTYASEISGDGREMTVPIFKLGEKIGKSKHLLIWTSWNREILWGRKGLTKDELLMVLADNDYYLEVGSTEDENVPYFVRITDEYELSGMNVFVIPVPEAAKKDQPIHRWMQIYREQKWQVIREGERDWREFKRNSAWYMKEIMQIIPVGSRSPVERTQVFKQATKRRRKDVWKALRVWYISGKVATYTFDRAGLAKAREDCEEKKWMKME